MCKAVLLQPPTHVTTERTTALLMSMEEHVPSWVMDQDTFAAVEKGGFLTLICLVQVS